MIPRLIDLVEIVGVVRRFLMEVSGSILVASLYLMAMVVSAKEYNS